MLLAFTILKEYNLTYDIQINIRYSCWSLSEVNSALVGCFILSLDIIQDQSTIQKYEFSYSNLRYFIRYEPCTYLYQKLLTFLGHDPHGKMLFLQGLYHLTNVSLLRETFLVYHNCKQLGNETISSFVYQTQNFTMKRISMALLNHVNLRVNWQ